jgi:phosphatidylglycerophosphatase C
VVVFDFDGTLFDGDLGFEWLRWRLLRSPWRLLLLLLCLPLWAPLFTRRRWVQHGVAACFWIVTLGEPLADPRVFLAARGERLRRRLLAAPMAALIEHRSRGDTVVIATGGLPVLVEGLLAHLPGAAPRVFGSSLLPGRFGVWLRWHLQGGRKLGALRDAGLAPPFARVYTDSLTDLPLLRAALRGVLVSPERRRARLESGLQRHAGLPSIDWMLH